MYTFGRAVQYLLQFILLQFFIQRRTPQQPTHQLALNLLLRCLRLGQRAARQRHRVPLGGELLRRVQANARVGAGDNNVLGLARGGYHVRTRSGLQYGTKEYATPSLSTGVEEIETLR